MIKSIQAKILILISVVGLVIIIGMGSFNISIIQNSKEGLKSIETIDKAAIINAMDTQISQTKILILVAILVFSLIMILISIYVAKSIIAPINRIVVNAEKIANGENVELIKISERRRRRNRKKFYRRKKSEVDTLSNVIGAMTGQLKENLQSVNDQKREIEAILLHMEDGIIAFNSNGLVTHINPAARDFLDLEKTDNTFKKIINEKLGLKLSIDSILYLESYTSYEHQRVTVGEKTLNISFATFKDENDIQSGVIAVVQDITEHVKLDDMRKEFVANVSHELKTPITSIIGYADTLAEGDYDKETEARFLKVISSEGSRMAKLVSDLLTLSRFDTKRVSQDIKEFNLGDLTKKCLEKLQIEADKKEQEIECFTTSDIPLIKADKPGIERVILNILSNAIKYTPEKGNIKIYTGSVYNDVYVKVIDTGIGIPKEDINRIFERFYRVDKARSRDMGGTGLGLSIAKEIVTQNNGSIDIKSELGKGTEVVIRLPAIKKAKEEETEEEKEEGKEETE